MSSTSQTVHISGRFVRWRRGDTNIIHWIYVYGYFLPFSLHVLRLRRVDMLSFSLFFLSVCCLAHRSPHPLCFPSVISLSTSFLCSLFFFFFSSRPTHALPRAHSFYQFIFPLSLVMFSSSCYVANLAHRPLIENQDDSGGGSFLPVDCTSALAVALVRFPGIDKKGVDPRRNPRYSQGTRNETGFHSAGLL